MRYLRDNSERLVINYIIDVKPSLITELNLKEWFFHREGKALAWAILKHYKRVPDMHNDNPVETRDAIFEHIDFNRSGTTEEMLREFLKIDLVDDESMQQVILYFKFMGMFFEMYQNRDNFSEKEIAAMQAIAELVKRGEVNQKVIDIVIKLYDKHIGDKFYNKQLKQDIIIEKQQQNKQKWL